MTGECSLQHWNRGRRGGRTKKREKTEKDGNVDCLPDCATLFSGIDLEDKAANPDRHVAVPRLPERDPPRNNTLGGE